MSESMSHSIQTRDLSLWYGKFQALKAVNLNVRSGWITSLIGPRDRKSTRLNSSHT